MSIVLAIKNGKINNDIREYYIDSNEEVSKLPTNPNIDGYVCTGSTAYVVTTGQIYMFSSQNNKWIEQ